MRQNTDFRDYNTELFKAIVAPMAMTTGFEPRRQLFRQHTHRAFEPQFFPSFMQLTIGMATGRSEKDQMVMWGVFAAVVFELRDFLAGLESKSLNPLAVALEVLMRPLAAAINPELGLDPGVETAKVFIRHRHRLENDSAQIFAEIERLASAAEERSHGEGKLFEVMRDQAADFRDMPRRLRIMGQLLKLAELQDEQKVRQEIQCNRSFFEPPEVESPEEPAVVLHWITEALKETAAPSIGLGFVKLLMVMLEEGVGVSLSAIEDYLTRGVVADSEAFDGEGNMVVRWPGEDSARHELARAGPAVVLPSLRAMSKCIKSSPGVMQIFARVSDLLLEVIESSKESANASSVLLASALTPSEDSDVRALAAIFCGLNGVNSEVVRNELMRVCAQDSDPWVKLGSAAVLVATPGTPDDIGLAAMSLIMDWLQRTQPPELMKLVLSGSDADAAGIVISLLPGLIAERGLPTQAASVARLDMSEESGVVANFGGSEARDPTARLRQLEELRANQLISEDEYQSKRKAILDGL